MTHTTDPHTTIHRALENTRGDDLSRARAAFTHLSASAWDEPWGQSDQTPRQILAAYEARERDVTDAITWLKDR